MFWLNIDISKVLHPDKQPTNSANYLKIESDVHHGTAVGEKLRVKLPFGIPSLDMAVPLARNGIWTLQMGSCAQLSRAAHLTNIPVSIYPPHIDGQYTGPP
jgi:hypothetical protein